MTVWAGYTRVSRVGDRAETLISPDLQAQRIRQYAQARGIEVEIQEPELDVSGGSVERPILSEVIERIATGEFTGIVVAQLDRLSRMGIADALGVIQRIEQHGGEVIAVAENFDAGTPEGRLARNMFLSLGEMQLDRYKIQFRSAKAQAVERGIWPTPTPPLGYRKGRDRKLEPDRPELIVKAFEQRAAGKSWSTVADILGVSVTNAGKVIRNRAYLGELRLGEWVNLAAHEPIVPVELFEAAQLSFPRPPRSHVPSLLAGLVRCMGCQRVMTPERDQDYPRYRCFRRNVAGYCEAPAIIGIGKLDEYVEQVMLGHFSRVHVDVSQRSERVDEAMRVLEAAEAELVAFQEVTRVLSDPQAFATGLRGRVEAVDQAREAVGHARSAVPLPDLGSLAEAWPALSVSERNHVLRGALDAVFVRKGRGEASRRVRLVAQGFGRFPGPGDPVVPLGDRALEGEIRVPPP